MKETSQFVRQFTKRSASLVILTILGACASESRRIVLTTAPAAPNLASVSRDAPVAQSGIVRMPATDENMHENMHENIQTGESALHPPFQWPLEQTVVINYYGWRTKSRKRMRMHEGVDLRAAIGTSIFSADAGEVILARTMHGYGRTVIVDHGNGWSTLYGHMSKVKVKRGTVVAKGEELGLSGKTGRSRGPHLHFEIRKGSDPLDPLVLLPRGNKSSVAMQYDLRDWPKKD